MASSEDLKNRKWKACIAVEGFETADGRRLEEGSLTWSDDLLAVLAPFETQIGVVGFILQIWREGNEVWAEGTICDKFVELADESGNQLDVSINEAERFDDLLVIKSAKILGTTLGNTSVFGEKTKIEFM